MTNEFKNVIILYVAKKWHKKQNLIWLETHVHTCFSSSWDALKNVWKNQTNSKKTLDKRQKKCYHYIRD